MQPLSSPIKTPFSRQALHLAGPAGNVLFHVVGFYFEGAGALKKVGKSLGRDRWKLLDHGAKAAQQIGNFLVRAGFLLESADSYLSLGKTAKAAIKIATPVLVGVGVAFSTASLFNDGRNIYKIWQFQKKFTPIHAQWQTGLEKNSFKTRDAAFVALLQLIETTQPGIIRKAYGVDKAVLKTRLEQVYQISHDDKEKTVLFRRLDKRISAQLTNEVRNVAADVANIISCVFLIIPILEPAGYVFFAISLGLTFYNYKYEARDGYNFERKLGLINKSANSSEPKSFKRYLMDKYGVTAFIQWIKPKRKEPALPSFRATLNPESNRYRFSYN